MFDDEKELFASFRNTLKPLPEKSSKLWKLSEQDAICFFCMLFTTITIWIVSSFNPESDLVLKYWDGPNYLFAGITLYNISNDNPWTKYFQYQPKYFACHLPGYPLLIRACSIICLGNWSLAFYLSILVSGLLLVYTFRRVLIAYDCVKYPTFTTILVTMFPMRLVIYHSVGASEPLFIACICLAMTFYKTGNYWPMMFSVWYGCLTRIEGMAIGAAIGLCYLLQFDIAHALSMFLTFLMPAALMSFHKIMFGSALAYIEFNSGSQGLIGKPFAEVISRYESNDILYIHSFLSLYIPFAVLSISILPACGPLGIFSLIFVVYVACLHHLDLFRYALPGYTFALLIGIDPIISNKRNHYYILCTLPFIYIFEIIYAKGQIASNSCGQNFLEEVLKAAK